MQPKDFQIELSREIARMTDKLLVADWSDNRVYAEWLAQTYHFVSHTGRLICSAAGRFSLQDDAFHKMMTSHFREEEDHDVMARKDVEGMGFKMPAEWPLTKVFVDHLRFEIEHRSPFCIFGRIYFLEGLACEAGVEILSRLSPSAQKSFLKLHAEEDISHHAESLKLLQRMTPEQVAHVNAGFVSTIAIYEGLADRFIAPSVRMNAA